MRQDLHGRTGMLGVTLLLAARAAFAVCASTPAAAVSLNETNGGQMVEGDDGYRVTSVRWDLVLRQGWAMVVRCGHPGWPEVALPTRVSSQALKSEEGKTFTGAAGAALMVRAGDRVRLWRREDELRIEVAAVAEESGGVGKNIRVRLVRAGMEGQVERQMVGVVRGPEDVEMQR